MRYYLLVCLLLLACTPPQKGVVTAEFTGASVYSCTDQGCFEGPPESYTYVPPVERFEDHAPNYSRDYNIKPRTPVTCQTYGCGNNMEAVGDKESRLWYPCECESARNIPFESIRCFRDFEEAREENYVYASACAANVSYVKGTR